MTGVLSIDAGTLPELLEMRAGALGDATFVRNAEVEWSYGTFGKQVSEVAGGLRELGVERGEAVAVILPNCPEYLEAWWGILWAGAVFNPVNPTYTAREATQILADSEAVALICTREMADGLAEIGRAHV